MKRREDLMMQKQSIQVAIQKQSEQVKVEYRIRLNAFVVIARLLLYYGLTFRAHESSIRKGTFRTLLEFYAKKN